MRCLHDSNEQSICNLIVVQGLMNCWQARRLASATSGMASPSPHLNRSPSMSNATTAAAAAPSLGGDSSSASWSSSTSRRQPQPTAIRIPSSAAPVEAIALAGSGVSSESLAAQVFEGHLNNFLWFLVGRMV